MKALPVVCALAAVATPAAAEEAPDPQEAVVAAIAKRSAVALAARVSSQGLNLSHILFADPKCRALEGKAIHVAQDSLDLAAACLADLGIKRVDGVWQYGPGIAVNLVLRDGAFRAIGATPYGDGTQRRILPRVFRANVAGKLEAIPDAAVRAQLAKDPAEVAHARFTVCADATGRIDLVRVAHRVDDPFPTYGATVEAAVRAWKVAPFTLGGKAIGVCAVDELWWPQDRKLPARVHTIPPPPPPPPRRSP